MKNQERVNQSRRNAVLGSAAGATAFTAWQTPAINSVLLPAHAAMSEETSELIFTLSGTGDSIFSDTEMIEERLIEAFPEASELNSMQGKKESGAVAKVSLPQQLLDFVVPQAQAGLSSSEDLVSFYLASNGDDTYKFQWYSSMTEEGCLIESLFEVDSIAVGDTESLNGFNCYFGLAASGAFDVTLVSIADDESSAVIALDEGLFELELALDPEGAEFEMPELCECVIDLLEEEDEEEGDMLIIDGPDDLILDVGS